MSETIEVDGEVVDAETGEIVNPSRALIPSASIGEIARRVSSEDALHDQQQLMVAYDRACKALIGPNDVQVEGDKEFKKKSAWRKLGRHFGISTEVVASETWWEKNEWDDLPHCVSRVTVRATSPWGQHTDAIGKCSTRESRFYFSRSGEPNDKARMKADHDCEATAETRAHNRAVSNLIAMGEVSAEEVEGGFHEDRPKERRTYRKPKGSPEADALAPTCPDCGGPMWSNIEKKAKGEYSPKAPDFKCKDKACGGVIWDAGEGGSEEGTSEAEGSRPVLSERGKAQQRFLKVIETCLEDGETAEGLARAVMAHFHGFAPKAYPEDPADWGAEEFKAATVKLDDTLLRGARRKAEERAA